MLPQRTRGPRRACGASTTADICSPETILGEEGGTNSHKVSLEFRAKLPSWLTRIHGGITLKVSGAESEGVVRGGKRIVSSGCAPQQRARERSGDDVELEIKLNVYERAGERVEELGDSGGVWEQPESYMR